jgi:pyridoxamine 5'-phosphate oxidase family protein
MAVFTEAEIAYLATQRLGRLATVSKDGSPHVVPVTFRYNPDEDTIDIGGHNFAKRKKYRDAQRDGRVAFVVDDVLPPWSPRMIEIRGRADVLASGGKTINADFDDEMFRIHPVRILSFGIDGAESIASRDV